MKVITEAFLRDELRMETPEVYIVPDGKILSPAAREYLMQRKIKIKLPKQLRFNPEPSKPDNLQSIDVDSLYDVYQKAVSAMDAAVKQAPPTEKTKRCESKV